MAVTVGAEQYAGWLTFVALVTSSVPPASSYTLAAQKHQKGFTFTANFSHF